MVVTGSISKQQIGMPNRLDVQFISMSVGGGREVLCTTKCTSEIFVHHRLLSGTEDTMKLGIISGLLTVSWYVLALTTADRSVYNPTII